jgi:hypothetical protein
MVSTARVLYELERRFGAISDATSRPISVALYADYLLEGGDPDDEDGFQTHIDGVEDLESVTKRVETLLADPTDGGLENEEIPSYGPPSPLRESGT